MSVSDSLFCENAAEAIEGPWQDGGGNEYVDVCPVECAGDVTGDGTIDVSDLLAVIADWGNPYDVGDLLTVIGEWGEACP